MNQEWFQKLLKVFVCLYEKAYGHTITSKTSVAIFYRISGGGLIITAEKGVNQMELREGQFFNVSAAFKTQAGNPATYEAGSVSWESSDPAIASVEANPDNELEAKVSGLDGSNNGSAVIEFRADGDPDADQVRVLIATLAVTVTQGEAFVAELVAGAAQDNPEVPTPGPDPDPEPAPPEPTPDPDTEPPVPTEPTEPTEPTDPNG